MCGNMNTVRCLICRKKMRTLKSLTAHYLKGHSKLKIVKQLLELSISRMSPILFKHRNKDKLRYKPKKLRKKFEFNSKSLQTETLYLNENIRILCGQNEIIIGDNNNNIDMEFSFDDSSYDSKENCVPLNDDQNISTSDCPVEIPSGEDYNKLCSPSASSEGSAASSKISKRKMKRKKGMRRKMSHYCIDITKLQDLQSLDDKNGYFYTCYCREKLYKQHIMQKTDLRIITSDTESCSDTSKNTFMPIIDSKIFCNKCGSGYKTETELKDHMYVHESFCRLCNISFPCEFSFKQHMQLHIFRIFICHICFTEFPYREMLLKHFDCHIEDHTFETVLDMEEEYKIYRCNFVNKNYHSSINSIICFLSERSDIYYCSYKFAKLVCDICYNEVYLHDYERHIQMCKNHKIF